ncbi:MAG: glycosyltransferase family 4 protein [Candidatus Marinimicrobia bacterium]|nr:glycosyltransferase family 4 protein [Candidatus Neomarinimicrobiota bacterium]
MNLFIDARMIRQAGIGTYLQGLIKGLLPVSEIRKLYLGGTCDKLENFTDRKILVRHNMAPIYSPREQLIGWWNMKKLGSSVDLAHYPNYNTYHNPNWPYVVTIHDLIQFQFNYGNSFKRKLARHLLRHVLSNARHVICISKVTKITLTKFSPNLDKEKISVVYNPVDHLKDYRTDTSNMVQLNKPYILCVGSRKPHKNFSLVIEALDLLNDKYPGLSLVIIGTRFRKPDYIDEAIHRRRNRSLIILLEDVPDEELNGYYQKAQLVIVPSLAEGFGFVPFASALRGTCPIISDIPVHRELFGDSLPFFNPHDPTSLAERVSKLIESPQEQSLHIEKVKTIAEKYTTEKFIYELMDIYRSVVIKK